MHLFPFRLVSAVLVQSKHSSCTQFKFKLRVCLVLHFTQKILGFGSSFCKIELNTIQIFSAKMYLFFILDFGLKRPKQNRPIKNWHFRWN
jgi:hypothetical protein